jgi:hypothetical protein
MNKPTLNEIIPYNNAEWRVPQEYVLQDLNVLEINRFVITFLVNPDSFLNRNHALDIALNILEVMHNVQTRHITALTLIRVFSITEGKGEHENWPMRAVTVDFSIRHRPHHTDEFLDLLFKFDEPCGIINKFHRN